MNEKILNLICSALVSVGTVGVSLCYVFALFLSFEKAGGLISFIACYSRGGSLSIAFALALIFGALTCSAIRWLLYNIKTLAK